MKGRDFEDVCSPVINCSNLMLMLAMTLSRNWITAHVDVKSEFFNGDIDCDLKASGKRVDAVPDLAQRATSTTSSVEFI